LTDFTFQWDVVSIQPHWWSLRLEQEIIDQATSGLPNEVIGFICQRNESSTASIVWLNCGLYSPTSFSVHPQLVIDFVLNESVLANYQVLATIHSHPNGRKGLSEADMMLFDWAPYAYIAVKLKDGWLMDGYLRNPL